MSQYVKALLDIQQNPSGSTVTVSNHPTSIEVSNHPTSVEVSNHPTSVEVSNHPTSIEVSNFPVSQVVTGNFYPASQVVSGSVSVSNQISGFSTETTLSSLDGKISTGSGDVASGTHIQQVLTYGLDSAGVKHPLDVDSNGHLKITQQDKEIQRATTTITTDFGGGALSGSFGDGKETAYWDSQNYDKFQAVISNTNGAFMSLRVQASTTTDNADFVDIDEAFELGVGDDHLFRWTANDAFQRYYRFKNSTGSPITFDSIQVHFLK